MSTEQDTSTQKILRIGLPIVEKEIRLTFTKDVKILHFAEDRHGLDRIDMWVQDDPDAAGSELEHRYFRILGTGQRVPVGYTHVGTVVMKNNLVWHVYAQKLDA